MSLDDPVALAEAAAILRRALSRTANPPGDVRDAPDLTSAPEVRGNLPTRKARPGIALPAGQPNPA